MLKSSFTTNTLTIQNCETLSGAVIRFERVGPVDGPWATLNILSVSETGERSKMELFFQPSSAEAEKTFVYLDRIADAINSSSAQPKTGESS